MRLLTSSLLMVLFLSLSAKAELVELSLTPELTVLADYQAGFSEKPALLLLHGFLQTHHFSTVSRLSAALGQSGYSVLTPTLSLNLDQRKQSLDCNAIHTHSMADDIGEIKRWLDWLEARGHQRVILIGHSFGSLQLTAYQTHYRDPRVSALILISLVHADQDLPAAEKVAMQARLQTQLGQAESMPDRYQISFCKNYLSLPQAFNSYLEWGEKHLKTALHSLQVPVNIIIGGKDNRIDSEWIDSLQMEHLTTHLIKGANHFFDDEFEFDIQEKVESLLP